MWCWSIFRKTVDQPEVLLPVGISFYTFPGTRISGGCLPERDCGRKIRFAMRCLYHFSQLVAELIERSGNLEQIREVPYKKTFEYHRIVNGPYSCCMDFFLKMVLARAGSPLKWTMHLTIITAWGVRNWLPGGGVCNSDLPGWKLLPDCDRGCTGDGLHIDGEF